MCLFELRTPLVSTADECFRSVSCLSCLTSKDEQVNCVCVKQPECTKTQSENYVTRLTFAWSD